MLQNKAMLASCNIKRWNPKVLDRKVSKEVQQQHNAASDAGDFRKQLVDKEMLAALSTSATTIRELHYKLTLPWDDDGARILPASLFQKYTDQMRTLKSNDEKLRYEFFQVYPQLVAQAPRRLGSMFNPADFPAPHDLPSKFDVKLTFKPVPSDDDFRVDVGNEAASMLREQLKAENDERFQAAMKHCYTRLHDVISHISTTLHKEDPRIFETLVTNATDLIDCLPDLNLAGDPLLDQLRQDLANMLPVKAAAFKNNPVLRKKVADEADEILERMKGYM
jgi:hypothetical protein